MAKIFKTKQAKKRMIAVLSVVLATSCTLGAFTACNNGSTTEDEDPSETVTKTDTQLIKNGNFEFYSDNNVTDVAKKFNLISSPDSWSRSTGSDSNGSAPTSESASGIVNTAEWDNFTRPGAPFTSKEDALARWDSESVTAYDRIKFYDAYDVDSKDDFKYYSDYSYSIDYDDVKHFWDSEKNVAKVANPLTHDGNEDETSVLMIQNQKITNSVYGTAQYYTSSTTVTLAAGTAAELSVWVKTSNLVHYDNQTALENCGAYIGVTHTVGGTTLDQMQIKNINTEQQNTKGENNGWVEYKLYVRANTFATSTFKIVLGLGMGSTTDMYETVNGYAFFDDLSCKIISGADYETATDSLPETAVCDVNDYGADKKFDMTNNANRTFALNLFAGFENLDLTGNVAVDLTKEVYGDREYTSETYKNLNIAKDTKSVTKLTTVADLKTEAASNTALKAVMDNDFAKFPFGDSEQVIMLMSNNGAPYTATVESAEFTLAPKTNKLVSFFVKTSEMQGFTGAGITVVDGETETSIANVDTTKIASVDIDKNNKDIYDGWAQCFFFLKNETDETKTCYLECTYGSTTIVGTTVDSYTDGYAAFTNFEVYDLSDREASYATTGDRAKTVSLTGKATGSSQFDNVIQNNPSSIETDIAKPANYWGVVGGDKRVGGENDSVPNVTPENVYAGLVNADYAADYASTAWKSAICTIAAQKGVLTDALASNWWETIFGSAKQPLAIVNQAAAAYGYIAQTTTNISSTTYQRISVRVKVSADAKAYVYLIDASDLQSGYNAGLTPNMVDVTYWYDDEGNVTALDPADEDFDKKGDIVYLLGENGLYTNAKDKADTKLYANLANYATDADGNLVTEEDTVAYYAKDGKFYAYYDENKNVYSTEVVDFDHQYARYDYSNATMPESVIVVDGTDADVANKWVTVAFNVHANADAKDYRLEVWSGSRDGKNPNPANSYVLFDNVTSADVSSDYTNLLNDAVAALKDELSIGEEENLPAENALYYTYTFYDDTSYLRYDKTVDAEGVNPYASYKQSSNTEQIAYLYYEDSTSSSTELLYQMFLDYGATDVTVERDVAEEDKEEDTTTPSGELDFGSLMILMSSILLVVALVAVIIIMAVRRILKRRPAKVNRRVAYGGKRAPKKKTEEKPVEVVEEVPETPADENDPYNE